MERPKSFGSCLLTKSCRAWADGWLKVTRLAWKFAHKPDDEGIQQMKKDAENMRERPAAELLLPAAPGEEAGSRNSDGAKAGEGKEENQKSKNEEQKHRQQQQQQQGNPGGSSRTCSALVPPILSRGASHPLFSIPSPR